MTSFLILLIVVLVLAFVVFAFRWQEERRELRAHLRQVLRAAASRSESQDNALGWYESICELLPHPVFVTDDEKKLLYANPPAQQQFGQLAIEDVAIRWLRNHHLESQLDEVLQEGESPAQMLELQDEQFLVQAAQWQNTNGELGGVTMLLQNVTELSRLARARRDMAANLSHELRTPLASIKLMTETLLQGAIEDPEFGRRLVTRVAAENEALIRLVEDLTALHWIESQRTPLRLQHFNLYTLVEQRLERLAPQRSLKQVQYVLESEPNMPVYLDPERFGQVLTNVFHNAIKFSPTDSTITIRIQQDQQQTTLTIADQGFGIQPTDLPRIFERFYKSDPARTRTARAGTGLGLAIAKHLVEAHNGTISASNNPERGATFTILLPHLGG
ncbi:MAG: sensor histidine kinase [Ardenticatenaceae bacterium]